MRAEVSNSQIQIINTCTDPPMGLEWQVRRSLRWIEKSHLNGLSYIRLEDTLPELDSRADEWAKRAVAEGQRVYGWYSSRERGKDAYILLYVKEIYRSFPRILWWSSVPTLRIVRSLAHEVAHHLVTTQAHVFGENGNCKDEESIANKYAGGVLARMQSKWLNRLGQWCLRELASWHYVFGIADYNAEKYGSAADYFYKSWDLDPQNQDALNLYWRAREMSDGKSS